MNNLYIEICNRAIPLNEKHLESDYSLVESCPSEIPEDCKVMLKGKEFRGAFFDNLEELLRNSHSVEFVYKREVEGVLEYYVITESKNNKELQSTLHKTFVEVGNKYLPTPNNIFSIKYFNSVSQKETIGIIEVEGQTLERIVIF